MPHGQPDNERKAHDFLHHYLFVGIPKTADGYDDYDAMTKRNLPCATLRRGVHSWFCKIEDFRIEHAYDVELDAKKLRCVVCNLTLEQVRDGRADAVLRKQAIRDRTINDEALEVINMEIMAD